MAERREPEPECNPNPNVTLTLTLTPREEGLGFNTGFGLEGYASLEIDGIQMLFPTGSPVVPKAAPGLWCRFLKVVFGFPPRTRGCPPPLSGAARPFGIAF